MKNARRSLIATLTGILLVPFCGTLRAQDIENVIVETYYVSDANDATDVIGGPWGLAVGSITYRIYLDLCDSCALRAVYGSTDHSLRIESTAPVFNYADERGRIYGHEISNSALDEGTLALDSWLAMGGASTQRYGVLKAEDDDGSIVGGANNDGGSEGVEAGLLVNSTAEMGYALTERDGLAPLNGGLAEPVNFLQFGDDPGDAFFDTLMVNGFASTNFRMGCATPGVKGPTANNTVIVAQITTTGDLSFELNVEIEHSDGNVVRYVARDTVLAPDETPVGLLVYPPECGCTDPNFLEYDPGAGCDDGSCQTAIVFGCLDTLACNFDPTANFHVSQLCCYGPGNCNGLDIDVVCAGVGMEEHAAPTLEVFPIPAHDRIQVRANGIHTGIVRVTVVDLFGRTVIERQIAPASHELSFELLLDALPAGMYILRLAIDNRQLDKRIVIDRSTLSR